VGVGYALVTKDQDMENYEKIILGSFNNTIGAILTYLDEAEVGFGTKKAVKSELWELCDKKIMPIMAEGLGHEQTTEDETFGNRSHALIAGKKLLLLFCM
jgi:hypothetical protein